MSLNHSRISAPLLGVLALAACSESRVDPTAVKTEAAVAARPSTARLTSIGDHATWYFQAVVTRSVGSSAQVDDTVSGQLTFAIASDASFSDDGCTAKRAVTSSATFTVHSQTYTLSGGPNGESLSITSCGNENIPKLVVTAVKGDSAAKIVIRNPADNFDFPLVPPAITDDQNVFSFQTQGSAPPPGGPPSGPTSGPLGGTPGGPPGGPGGILIEAKLTKLFVGLQTKADCKNNGWAQFGFKNQGQCVRFIETGKDSR